MGGFFLVMDPPYVIVYMINNEVDQDLWEDVQLSDGFHCF